MATAFQPTNGFQSLARLQTSHSRAVECLFDRSFRTNVRNTGVFQVKLRHSQDKTIGCINLVKLATLERPWQISHENFHGKK
jgi:hypothetical protein